MAAGYAFSDAAGAFATIVKLTRTLSIIPIVLIFSIFEVARRGGRQDGEEALNRWAHLRKVSPWFILWFVGIALLNSLNLIPQLVGGRGLKGAQSFFDDHGSGRDRVEY